MQAGQSSERRSERRPEQRFQQHPKRRTTATGAALREPGAFLGVAIYDRQGISVAITHELTKTLTTTPASNETISRVTKRVRSSGWAACPCTFSRCPIRRQDEVLGGLGVVHDVSYIRAQILLVWRRDIFSCAGSGFSHRSDYVADCPLEHHRPDCAGSAVDARAAHWKDFFPRRDCRISTCSGRWREKSPPWLRASTTLATPLKTRRACARRRNPCGLRIVSRCNSALVWTTAILFVVSNREPYMHQRNGKALDVVVPPSGLVTALEPVLNACDGTWIAHGSGSADAEVVDAADRLRVPPDDPRYSLRRVWLTKEEEEGYYYGFANEGLWPLCHIAHTRPLFRADDWQHYQDVNRKFMDAVLEEIEDVAKPVVLVQDYHFALLPRLIKEKRPDARVAIFWHIPWPNPEAFGICPWQRQLVDGLLGADLIGFHIQSHCNNFLETVDRVVESRVDWEHFSVLRQDHRTLVRPFPISVAFTDDDSAEGNNHGSSYLERSALLRSLGVEATYMGIGVDRVDYTKGILERFLAIERFLEKYPSYQGKFTFVQIGAPSRTHIKRYHDLLAEVEAEAERINWRFQSGKWKPIVFLKRQHSHQEIEPYYRAADLCLVTSLHDGMNLVAKEFLAARRDEHGVLILSQFTGAARELRDALLVNPYDIDQTAEAIRTALEMEPEDKQLRVHRMRKIIKEHNIYRWAGNLITELCEVRLDAPEDVQEKSRATCPG